MHNRLMRPGPFAYFEGEIRSIDDARVSIMTHSFNYGTALFEGIRGYYVPDENDILDIPVARACRTVRSQFQHP
jgi:hypothetical protein